MVNSQSLITNHPAYGRLNEVTETLKTHPIFSSVRTIEQLRAFMEWHVFAVWDFMSLVKRIQSQYASTRILWVPSRNSRITRFINEIVLAEESDVLPNGTYCSHFELYLQAMKEIGASTETIDKFISQIQFETPVSAATKQVGDIDPAICQYVERTTNLALRAANIDVLGEFVFGRENVIPGMFRTLLKELDFTKEQCPLFIHYLERHIEIDGDDHGPMALGMLEDEAMGSETLVGRAIQTGIAAIESRILFWDKALETIKQV